MIRTYNKLVRDNIPEIIRNNNEIPNTRILDNQEYAHHLKNKLQEEVGEFLESDDTNELADILEVVDALAKNCGSSFDEIIKIKDSKARSNGKFDNRIFLIDVIGKE